MDDRGYSKFGGDAATITMVLVLALEKAIVVVGQNMETTATEMLM